NSRPGTLSSQPLDWATGRQETHWPGRLASGSFVASHLGLLLGIAIAGPLLLTEVVRHASIVLQRPSDAIASWERGRRGRAPGVRSRSGLRMNVAEFLIHCPGVIQQKRIPFRL